MLAILGNYHSTLYPEESPPYVARPLSYCFIQVIGLDTCSIAHTQLR